MENEKIKKIALKISAKLESKIIENRISLKELSEEIEMNIPNVSRNRNLLKRGKMPSLNFLIGISIYFDENFLCIKDA